MYRRQLLRSAGVFALGGLAAACGANSKLPELPVAVTVALPPEIKEIIDDATAAIAKVESLGAAVSDTVKADIEKAKGYVSSLIGVGATGAGSSTTKTVVSGIVSALGSVATLLPPPYGTIALAIETLLPIIGNKIGMRMMARRPTGMTPATARAVLRS